jgi:hypothetical protein
MYSQFYNPDLGYITYDLGNYFNELLSRKTLVLPPAIKPSTTPFVSTHPPRHLPGLHVLPACVLHCRDACLHLSLHVLPGRCFFLILPDLSVLIIVSNCDCSSDVMAT